jgi:two-component system, NtrC family, response regulator GlrR
MAQTTIVILDDHQEQQVGLGVKAILERDSSYRVELTHATLLNVEAVFETFPDLIIPVLADSQEGAERLLTRLRTVKVDVPVLPVMSSENLNRMLEAPRPWTKDFLLVPLRAEEVRARTRQSLLYRVRAQETSSRKQQIKEPLELAALIGEAPTFVAVKKKIPLIAGSDCTVLITGETGTGKEMCARALHYLSRRAGNPFLPVNCGAIPEALFENELFGHHKGAFTGAWAGQRGLLEEAEGGTLLLDEIDSLSREGQVKLLRFLQDQRYYALGSPKARHANVRIIASTNVDLRRKTQEGTFREDLFYRLAVLTLMLPSLRERLADIPLLAVHFWNIYTETHDRSKGRLSSRAIDALCLYSWPGNVRELENVIQQLVVLTQAEIVEPQDLPIPRMSSCMECRGASFKEAKSEAIERFEKNYLTELLRVHQGNVTHAARAALKERRAFGRLIKKYQIAKP